MHFLLRLFTFSLGGGRGLSRTILRVSLFGLWRASALRTLCWGGSLRGGFPRNRDRRRGGEVRFSLVAGRQTKRQRQLFAGVVGVRNGFVRSEVKAGGSRGRFIYFEILGNGRRSAGHVNAHDLVEVIARQFHRL